MRNPRLRFIIPLVLIAGAGTILAQVPVREPFQSREPPFADDVEAVGAKGRVDPDASGIEQAQHLAPTVSPRQIPAGVGSPAGVIAGQSPVAASPAGELPTPVVTLNVEGNDITPSGQAVVYKLHVRNTSRAKAHNVVVKVVQPKNAERIKWEPVATHDDAEARWEFKTLDPGQEKTIEISYKPKPDTEEVKIQARVQFDFGRGMITKVAPPSLTLKKEGPETLVVGDVVTYRITVANNGRVTVRDIEVKEYLNKGLVYEDRELSRGTVDGRLMSNIDPKTGERTWTIPTLAPGQSKVIEYRVKARDPGRIASKVLAKATDVQKETDLDVQVMTANLQVLAEGPAAEKGTVGQPAGYHVVVENKGSADLKNVVVKCVFPPDMHPTKATNSGQLFKDHVQWTFREVKSGESKELNISLTTSTPGTRTVQFTAKADRAQEQRASAKATFAGVAALSWDTDVPGTIAAGKTMTYRVTVANTGSADAKGTKLQVDLPDNVDLIGTTPDAGKGVGQNAKMVIFPAYTIPAGKKTTYKIDVKARAAGEARVSFQLVGEGIGQEPAEHKKSTTITGSDTRSPSGPAPATPGKPDRSTIGSR
jgi:uncharacterized repeat protein (TIGR01451 family)